MVRHTWRARDVVKHNKKLRWLKDLKNCLHTLKAMLIVKTWDQCVCKAAWLGVKGAGFVTWRSRAQLLLLPLDKLMFGGPRFNSSMLCK